MPIMAVAVQTIHFMSMSGNRGLPGRRGQIGQRIVNHPDHVRQCADIDGVMARMGGNDLGRKRQELFVLVGHHDPGPQQN